MDTQERIIQLLIQKYGWTREEIINPGNYQRLGLDSLTIFSLVMELEEIFHVTLDIDDITEINSPMELIEYAKERVNNEM